MLAYERHGRGDPLVLVHGVTGRRQVWYPVLERVAAQRDVILVDLPGHGESPDLDPAGLGVVEALRRCFAEFLAEIGVERPHIAGNSLGGRIALEAAVAGDARSVTALSPAGFWRDAQGFATTRRLLGAAASACGLMDTRALPGTRAGRQLMYAMVMAHPGRVPVEHARADYASFVGSRPTLRLLLDAAETFQGQIPADVPVTIAWAARDLILPTWQAGVAREQLPNAEHLTMSGVGHVPMFDNPRLVADLLLHGSAPTATVAPIPTAVPPAIAARPATTLGQHAASA